MSKHLKLKLSPDKIKKYLDLNNINTLNPKFHTNQYKVDHIIIDSDRKLEERDDYKKKRFNKTFYEKESKNNNSYINKELPPVNYKKSYERYKFASTFYKKDKTVVKSLKKKMKELNNEINKLKKDSNVKNYNILENNYKQKSKEFTELKQENNFMRFQIEDLLRKNNNSNGNKTTANNKKYLINQEVLKKQKVN